MLSLLNPLKLSRLPSGDPEIFTSIQGEGVTAGVPSTFVRLSLCHLRCAFCDTPYTWRWDRYDPKTEIVRLTVPEVARLALAGGTRNVVITGGEPLLQQRGVAELAGALREAGRRLEVETSGSILPEEALAARIDQWNVSPKLENSGNEASRREVPEALRWFAGQPHAYLKFVVTAPADVVEVRELVDRYGVPPERVLLMPEGTTPAALAARSGWIVERCQALGYRFTTRLHVLLWGDTRGR